MRKLIGALLVFAMFLTLAGCPAPSPTPPNPNPIPPDPQCQGACTKDNSQICNVGGPTYIFGAEEVGLAALMVADPSTKQPIHTAYLQIQQVVNEPGVTWSQVTAVMAMEIAAATGTKWGPLIALAAALIEQFVHVGPIAPCDVQFLQQNCVDVIAMSTMPDGITMPYMLNLAKLAKRGKAVK